MLKNSYLLMALVVLSIISLFLGTANVNMQKLLSGEDLATRILILSRIPRLVAVIMAGMGMSISGLILQHISRNRFVAPTTAATIESAKLGLLVSLILFPGASSLGKMIIGFLFALGGTMLFMHILRSIKVKNAVFIPLIGIMLGNIIDAIATFIAYRYDLVQNISSWLMGNFAMITQGRYELLYLSIPLVIVAFLYGSKFTIAGMGEEFARNLGLNYQLVVTIGVVIVALLSSLVVITVGRIPFLGLIVPNIVAMYRGDNLRRSIGTTALLGSVFLLSCDMIGRIVIAPYEIPIGLTVGVIGSLAFLYLLFRRNRYA